MVADITVEECLNKMTASFNDVVHQKVDFIEEKISELPPVDCPVEHAFASGFYIRKTTLPTGTLLTSKIHKTRHPFVISQGDVAVWTESDGVVRLKAPYTGITNPGTRRVLYIHSETVWTTFHLTNETDVDEIERQIIEPHENPFLIDKEIIALCRG